MYSRTDEKPMRYTLLLDKSFSINTWILIIIGVLINVIFPRFVIAIHAPLYLDNIGSVIVAALGGIVPGMITAFVSNYLGYFGEASAIMFGILTVIMSIIAAYISERGLLRRFKGYLILFVCMICIGGAAGSVMGWYLYGQVVGGTIAAPYVFWLCGHGMSGFAAQFCGDMFLDITDKAITLTIVGLVLHYFPSKLRGLFPLGYLYGCTDEDLAKTYADVKDLYEGKSVYYKVIYIISIALFALSILITTFCAVRYYTDIYSANKDSYAMFAFVVQLVGLEFVIAILVLVFSGWNLYKTLKRPINVIVEQTLEFGASTPEKWMESNEWQKRKKIQTRDELQLVYDSVCESEKTICQKVISIRRNENELRQLSETDQMTRLYNRVSGEQKISEMISRNETGMLCILDCDHFKNVNDTFGHAVGDKVLTQIAKAMQQVCRQGDVILRLGGDEFAIFTKGLTENDVAEKFFDRLFEQIREIDIPEMKGSKATVSLGAVIRNIDESTDFDELYKKADEMLYKSKETDGFKAEMY